MTTRSLILSPNKIFTIMGQHLSRYEHQQFVRRLNEAGMTSAVVGVPWDLILRHEAQCQRNHYQTVQRLHERGGLSVDEAVAVLEDREWMAMDPVVANKRLLEIISAYIQENGNANA
jgi:hypothetical protein